MLASLRGKEVLHESDRHYTDEKLADKGKDGLAKKCLATAPLPSRFCRVLTTSGPSTILTTTFPLTTG